MNRIEDMIALKAALGNKFRLDSEITGSEEWMNCIRNLKGRHTEDGTCSAGSLVYSLNNMLSSFCNFETKYFYEISKDTISVYGLVKARTIWLNWWAKNKNKRLEWETVPGWHKYG